MPDFLVRRDDLRTCRIADSDPPSIESGQALLRVDTFGLTAGEARRLLSAGRGEALLLSGSHRVSFQSVASKQEHRLAAGLADLVDDDL